MRPRGYKDRIGPWLAKKEIMAKLGVPEEDIVVLDAGAYKGDYSAMLMRMWPNAQYYLFEPVPEAVANLRERFIQENVHILPMAVSNETAPGVDFYVGGQATEMSSLCQRSGGRRYYRHELDETIKVDVVTLDDFVRSQKIKKVHLLKADIQGGEGAMLEGAQYLLRYRKPAMIYLEVFFIPMYENCPLFWELCAELTKKKYSLFDIYSLGRAKVSRQLKYGDAMFVSNDVREKVLDEYPEEWLPKSLALAMGMK